MTKIAIISQPEQGVLIDVGGCASLQEATQQLTSTLQVSSQFWEDQPVDLNLGLLSLSREELGEILSTLRNVGVEPRLVFAQSASTKAALRAHNLTPASGAPAGVAGAKSAAPVDDADEKEDRDNRPATDSIVLDCRPDANEVSGTECGALQAVVPPVELLEDGAPPICDTEDQAPNSSAQSAGGADSELEQAAPAAPPPSVAQSAKPAVPHVLYLRQTLRSGQCLSHKGHLVIIGDVNPGAEVIAEGDITIWGVLRGVAHAGVGGNTAAEIRALRFDPLQLRIAHAIARAPDRPKQEKRSGPEIARIVDGTIRIASCTPD